MKNLMKLFTVCVFFILLQLSCENSTTGINPENSKVEDLLEHEWNLYLVKSDDGNMMQINSQEIFSINFAQNDTLGGIVDCNSYASEYSARDGGEIQIGPIIAMTEAYCGDESFDDKYMNALIDVELYEVNGEILKLGYGSEGILYFTKK
jgi:heat shock protein HslJ